MKNTKEIQQNLKKYYIGQLSRSDIITIAQGYLNQNIADKNLKNILELLTQSSVVNNYDYKRIEEIRLQIWPYLENIEAEPKQEISTKFLYQEVKNKKFEDPNTFKQEYSKTLNFLIKEYLKDGMSEHYLIELVNTISFSNNYTKIVVFEFTDLISTIIDIVDYEYYYLFDIESPKKALWNLEEQLHKYLTTTNTPISQ